MLGLIVYVWPYLLAAFIIAVVWLNIWRVWVGRETKNHPLNNNQPQNAPPTTPGSPNRPSPGALLAGSGHGKRPKTGIAVTRREQTRFARAARLLANFGRLGLRRSAVVSHRSSKTPDWPL